jgi:hypothetical protein
MNPHCRRRMPFDHAQSQHLGVVLHSFCLELKRLLVAAIEQYVARHNIRPKPFIWTKNARDVLRKIIRASKRLRRR